MSETTQRWVRGRPVAGGYGIPENDDGMLSLEAVTARLEAAQNYWIGTSSAAGQPHAVPVWAAWVEGALWFGAGPRSTRNLEANPRISIHLESATDVVILEGEAITVGTPDPAVSQAIDEQYHRKYDWRPSSESTDPVGAGWHRLEPAKIIAWTRFPADATRWIRQHDIANAGEESAR